MDVGLTLEELAREIRGETTISGDPQTHVLGVQLDSRHVQPGDMFVVRVGANVVVRVGGLVSPRLVGAGVGAAHTINQR